MGRTRKGFMFQEPFRCASAGAGAAFDHATMERMIARHSFPLQNANQPGERFPLGHDAVGDGFDVWRDEEVAIGKRLAAGLPPVDSER